MNIVSLCAYIIVVIPYATYPMFRSLQSLKAKQSRICSMLLGAQKSSYLGEPVSQLEHALQTADLIWRSGGGMYYTLAGLLHDMGHIIAEKEPGLMTAYGALRHEDLGAEFLMNEGFSAQVYEPVRFHVAAKRYLARDPNYYERISPASKCSLENQGGPMEEHEALEFESNPFFQPAILLRNMEERAKFPGKVVPTLEFYEGFILKDLTEQ